MRFGNVAPKITTPRKATPKFLLDLLIKTRVGMEDRLAHLLEEIRTLEPCERELQELTG